MKKIVLILSVCFLFITTKSLALTPPITDSFSNFQTILSIPSLNLTAPKVVEITFPGSIDESSIRITDSVTKNVEPFITSKILEQPSYTVSTSQGVGASLSDNNVRTYTDFTVNPQQLSNAEAQIQLTFETPTNIYETRLIFDQNSQKPDFVTIRAQDQQGNDIVILTRSHYSSDAISFPEKTIKSLSIFLEHNQPLRISGIQVKQRSTTIKETAARFLAKPGQSYQIYTNPDTTVPHQTQPPAGNLFLEMNVIAYSSSTLSTLPNPSYSPVDTDADQIIDRLDNCPNIANADQLDIDNDGIGEACDDTDYDMIINMKDNCPEDANPSQRDIDGDGIGDECDNQESRFTEQYPWLPWAAMGGAATVITVLITMMVRTTQFKSSQLRQNETELTQPPPPPTK